MYYHPTSLNSELILKSIESFLAAFADFAWGPPLLVLLLGGGAFFLIYSRLSPYRYLYHAIEILRGKYDDPDEEGQLSHYQALSTAIAATVGMGNISGVAVAITMGGPGALFWMWISALLGVATKFFTCTLAIMFRGRDSMGALQGGPMYVIVEGMGKSWRPLAVFFCITGMFGALPIFQANQLTETVREVLLIPNGITPGFYTNLITGLCITILVGLVIFGGIKRIGTVAGNLVPTMVVIYVSLVLYIIFTNLSLVPDCFSLILTDAFTGNALMGGVVGQVIIIGAKRAAFSNEAGIGTAPMAHGAAKTNEPVREGLIAMLGPLIDTIIICTMTALAIIITGSWKTEASSQALGGIGITLEAFNQSFPGIGIYLLMGCIIIFSFTTMFSMSYYGTKCFGFIAGAERQHWYNYFYVGTIIIASVASLTSVISLIDGMYAMMSIPTMISAIYLAPKVMEAARVYFNSIQS